MSGSQDTSATAFMWRMDEPKLACFTQDIKVGEDVLSLCANIHQAVPNFHCHAIFWQFCMMHINLVHTYIGASIRYVSHVHVFLEAEHMLAGTSKCFSDSTLFK